MQRSGVSNPRLHADHRIGKDEKIRTTADSLHWIGSFGISGIEVRTGGRCQMSASGKSHHADVVGVELILCSVQTRVTDRTLGIEQFDGMVISRSKAIGQNKCCYAALIQPVRYLCSFFVCRQLFITSARADHDAGMGWILRRQIYGQAWLI